MTLVVGFAPEKGDRSAMDLAATLARSSGEPLLIVSVVPAAWPTPVAGGTDREYAAWSRARGTEAVAEAEALIAEACPDLEARAVAVPGRSVPGTLVAQAEQAEASMVVIGSGHGGSWGHVAVNSTADRLLHSSPIPVAVATRGYRAEDDGRIARATCAFRGDDVSKATLVRAAEVCARVGAKLRVVTFGVRGRTMYPPEVKGAEDMVLEEFVTRTAKAQEEAVADLVGIIDEVESEVAVGRDWAEALEDLPWERDDVLVVGSSSASLMSRVFLGSSATRIVRHSPVPVIVVP